MSGAEVRVVRAVAVFAILTYLASWFANAAVPGYVDPLVLRAGIVAVITVQLAGTYTSAWVVKNLRTLLRASIYLVTFHDYLLLYWNRLHPLQLVGTYVLLAGVVAVSSLFVRRRGQFAAYLGTVVVLSVAVALAIDDPLTARPQFLIGIGAFAGLAYLAVRAHLRTLDELRESEAKARAVLQAVPDVLLQVCQGGVVRAVLGQPSGPLAARIGALAGRPLDEAIAEARPATIAASAKAIRVGEVRSVEGRTLVDGASFQVEVRLVDAGGGHCLALVRDVTREKELEERLRVMDRLAAIGRLASGMAHEINNPLAYVVANLDYVANELRRAVPADAGEESLKALADAAVGAERIRAIVKSLKQYARAEERVSLTAEVGECARAALKACEALPAHKAKLHVDIAKTEPARAEPLRLTQVLVNLLTNAIQAIPRPGAEEGNVYLRVAGLGGEVVIEVEDDGVGIPKDALGSIFDAFYTTKSPGGGTGLGLYVSHHIVTAFGGTIDVHSREGAGTRFRVRLHAATPKAEAA